MKKIIIEVTETGEIKIDAQGFKGADCTKATEAIEKALGKPSKDRTRKPEFYQGNSQQQRAGR